MQFKILQIGSDPVNIQAAVAIAAHRTGLEDSITIKFRFLEASRMNLFNSTVKEFTHWFPVPHVGLGNFGNATENKLSVR